MVLTPVPPWKGISIDFMWIVSLEATKPSDLPGLDLPALIGAIDITKSTHDELIRYKILHNNECVYIYIYTPYTIIYTYAYTCTCTYTYTYIYIYIYTYTDM